VCVVGYVLYTVMKDLDLQKKNVSSSSMQSRQSQSLACVCVSSLDVRC